MTGTVRTFVAICLLPLALAGCGRDEAKEKALADQVAAAEARADAAERKTREYAAALDKLRTPSQPSGPVMSFDEPGSATSIEGTGDAPMNTEQPFDPKGSGPAAQGVAQADSSTPHTQS